MKARCPICQRPLKGPLCVIHGPVGAKGGSIPSRTVAGVSKASSNITLQTPANTLKDIVTGTEYTISTHTIANPTEITIGTHGYPIGSTMNVYIKDSNSTPSIDGSYVATFTSSTKFTIPVNVTGGSRNAGKAYFLPLEWTPIAGSIHEVYTGTGIYSIYAKYTG